MLDISAVRAISLDLDDTLWPVWPTIARAELALQGWLAPRAPAAAALVADSQARAALRQQVMDERPDLHHDLSHQREALIRLALHQCGEDTAHASEAFEVFFAERNRVQFYDDALPALAQLAARYPVLALSNGNADVARVGVGHWFAGSLSARDAGVAKPDGRIFAAAASRLGLGPAQVLHVGDDAALDVLGALGAGMQAVWVNRDGHTWAHEAQPHATVTHLGELCELLAVTTPTTPAAP
jgi:putative hydrolase of the HAD superfamily